MKPPTCDDGLDGARLLGAGHDPHRSVRLPSITPATVGTIIADHPDLTRRCTTVLHRSYTHPHEELRALLVSHASHLMGTAPAEVFTSLARKLEADDRWARHVQRLRERREEELRARAAQEERDRQRRQRDERRRVTHRPGARDGDVDALVAAGTWDVRRCLRVLRRDHRDPEHELRHRLGRIAAHSPGVHLGVLLHRLADLLDDDGGAGTDVARSRVDDEPIHPRRHPRPDWHDRLR